MLDQRQPPAPANSPVDLIPGDDAQAPQPGAALCLSGGGYRAMLFHLGTLWRLNELGMLPQLTRISTVSGGSITGAYLGLKWQRLRFDADRVARNLESEIVAPVRHLASTTIDINSVLLGLLLPRSIASVIIGRYRKHLFGDATLQDLPDAPRLMINASNMQTGALWRFSKQHMADYRVGVVPRPALPLAVAVAASAAFPPFLSPVRLRLNASAYDPPLDEDLHVPPYTTHVALTDGGVYDNLGLETAWKKYDMVLVSDAGGELSPKKKIPGNWAQQTHRVVLLIEHQVRTLRKRQLVAALQSGDRKGAYWGIRTDIRNYRLDDALDCPHEKTLALAGTPSLLRRLPALRQERIINWGYAVCDAAMRKHVVPGTPPPASMPYPASGVG